MKRNVASQLDQLKSKLTGYVGLLSYRYANLCIEANPLALFSTQVKVDGQLMKIEDVAKVAVHEKYHFVIIPNYEEDFFPIGQAIMKEHPEFKQEVKSFDGYKEEDPEGKYLFYTMPEVNKDRHDTLLKAVDALRDECTEKMSLAQESCTAQLAIVQANASPAEQEQTADQVKEIMDKFNEMRDKVHDQKTKDIEDAYADYQARQAEKEAEKAKQQEESGNPMQMKME